MKIPVALVALALAGCATGYQQSGAMGGFAETQLAPDVFRVSYNGNGYTRANQAHDFALLRAAELTLASGFTHFRIADAKDATSKQIWTTPTVSRTNAMVTSSGQLATVNATTVSSGGETQQIVRPGVTILIRCLRANAATADAFDADFLQRSLRAKYKLPPAG